MRTHLILVWAVLAFAWLPGVALAQSASAVAESADPNETVNEAKLLKPANRLYFPSLGQSMPAAEATEAESDLRPVFSTFVIAGETPSPTANQLEMPAEKKPFDFFYYLKDGEMQILPPELTPKTPAPR